MSDFTRFRARCRARARGVGCFSRPTLCRHGPGRRRTNSAALRLPLAIDVVVRISRSATQQPSASTRPTTRPVRWWLGAAAGSTRRSRWIHVRHLLAAHAYLDAHKLVNSMPSPNLYVVSWFLSSQKLRVAAVAVMARRVRSRHRAVLLLRTHPNRFHNPRHALTRPSIAGALHQEALRTSHTWSRARLLRCYAVIRLPLALLPASIILLLAPQEVSTVLPLARQVEATAHRLPAMDRTSTDAHRSPALVAYLETQLAVPPAASAL